MRWYYLADHRSRTVRVPMLPMYTTESASNGHMNITSGPQSNGRRWLGPMTFSFTSYGLLTWRTPGNRRNYWKKLSKWKQYDALRKVGSCHSCGCHFDTNHLPEHCFKEFKVLPWPSHFPDLNPIKHKQIRSMQALPCNLQDSNCLGPRYHRTPSGVSWSPLLDRSKQKGDQHNIRRLLCW